MTTASEAVTAQTHPAWCEGCTSEEEGGAGHFGDHQTVELDLMPPRETNDDFHKLPGHAPASLSAYLAQPHGAACAGAPPHH